VGVTNKEEIQKLVNERAKTGSRILNKEIIHTDQHIGKYSHPIMENGKITGYKYEDTTNFVIHYDTRDNYHIVPAAPDGFREVK
jgi:hypothetical protein